MDSCEDQLSRESGRMKLSDLNEAWGSCLGDLSDREEQLKGALERAEKYQVMQPTACVMDLHANGVRYVNSLNISEKDGIGCTVLKLGTINFIHEIHLKLE